MEPSQQPAGPTGQGRRWSVSLGTMVAIYLLLGLAFYYWYCFKYRGYHDTYEIKPNPAEAKDSARN